MSTLRRIATAVGAGVAVLPWLVSTAAAQQLTLADVVSSALSTHPSVAAAAARVSASEESAAAARAARLPELSVDGSLTRFGEPMVVAPLHAFDPLNPPTFDRSLVQGRLGARYTVFDGGERGARIRAGDAIAQSAGFGFAATEMETIEGVVGAYLAVHTTRSVRDAAGAQVAALEAELARVERSLAAGTAAEVDLLRADATLQDARAQLASATARVGLAERSLARLSGIDPSRIVGRPLAEVSLGSPPGAADTGASPEVARARRGVSAAEARVAEQRSTRLPRIDASAGMLDFGTLEGGHTAEWQAGLQVSWPIFTGGARGALGRRAQAELDLARGELAAAELAAAQAVDAARAAITEADARRDALDAAVAQWTEVARIERLALDAGSGVQRDLLRAQAGLFQARAGLAQARHEAIGARVRLAGAQGVLDPTWIAQALEAER